MFGVGRPVQALVLRGQAPQQAGDARRGGAERLLADLKGPFETPCGFRMTTFAGIDGTDVPQHFTCEQVIPSERPLGNVECPLQENTGLWQLLLQAEDHAQMHGGLSNARIDGTHERLGKGERSAKQSLGIGESSLSCKRAADMFHRCGGERMAFSVRPQIHGQLPSVERLGPRDIPAFMAETGERAEESRRADVLRPVQPLGEFGGSLQQRRGLVVLMGCPIEGTESLLSACQPILILARTGGDLLFQAGDGSFKKWLRGPIVPVVLQHLSDRLEYF